MMQLTRRKLFAGVAAAGAATALTPLMGCSTLAAAPVAGKQAAAFYRYKVGNYECTSINDGSRSFPMPDTFVKNVPKDQALAAAEAA
jgi:secreted PhoX family phosphatase